MKKLWLMIGGLTVALVAVIAMRIYMNGLVDHLGSTSTNKPISSSSATIPEGRERSANSEGSPDLNDVKGVEVTTPSGQSQ